MISQNPNLKVCVCAVVEILESLSFVANASNLVLYMIKFMHMSPSKSANNVTNFIGTAFLLALLGGFCSDAFFTTYHTFLISSVFELLVCTLLYHIPTFPFQTFTSLLFIRFLFAEFNVIKIENLPLFLRDFQKKISPSFPFYLLSFCWNVRIPTTKILFPSSMSYKVNIIFIL